MSGRSFPATDVAIVVLYDWFSKVSCLIFTPGFAASKSLIACVYALWNASLSVEILHKISSISSLAPLPSSFALPLSVAPGLSVGSTLPPSSLPLQPVKTSASAMKHAKKIANFFFILRFPLCVFFTT